MDRNSLLRLLVIAGVGLLIFFGWQKLSGHDSKPQATVLPEEKYANAPGFTPDAIDPAPSPNEPNRPDDGELCTIKGKRFEAVLSPRGAGLKSFRLTDPQYALDLSTTPDVERWRNLRTLFRGQDANSQVKFDRFLWKLDRLPNDKGCTFTYEDEDVRIVKTVTASERPFELDVDTTVTNLASSPKRHQISIGAFAFRRAGDVKGSLGRVSPWQTELACAQGKDVTRKGKDDFKSGWVTVQGVDRYAAVNSHYFSQALVPVMVGEGVVKDAPTCAILTEDWPEPGVASDSDQAASIYHAKLVYPAAELAPHASATYKQVAFFGPKERHVLAHAAGGGKLSDVINLGFFTSVAKVLVLILVWIHDHLAFNWGVAIILMTIGLRTLLFPLTWKSIKTTIAMRKLKPEVDALNEKFKDDPQAKNMAMMELWKKHGVNPFGGCLPQLVQMPVWFAMYTTLQTAVEVYHVKFLWFADLSSPDKYYVLPLLLGAFMIVQQRIVPQQGMDPMQQKMMMYMLPAVFTVMMLFLPAALGVYMLTNSLLGIGQQLAVEKIAPRTADTKGGGGKEIVVKQKGGGKVTAEGLGKGKARV
jgi:YidC/Oxa1 family membrane protein insertase